MLVVYIVVLKSTSITTKTTNINCNIMSTETDQQNATLISIALLAYVHFSKANAIVISEGLRV